MDQHDLMQRLMLIRHSLGPDNPYSAAKKLAKEGRVVLVDEEQSIQIERKLDKHGKSALDSDGILVSALFILFPNIALEPEAWKSFTAIFSSCSVIGSRDNNLDYVMLSIPGTTDQTFIRLLERP